jgi:hypothetical protein
LPRGGPREIQSEQHGHHCRASYEQRDHASTIARGADTPSQYRSVVNARVAGTNRKRLA